MVAKAFLEKGRVLGTLAKTEDHKAGVRAVSERRAGQFREK